LPPEVAEDEKLVRAIKVPYHYDARKGRLKPAAFRPPRGTSLVSVIRLLMGADFCKNKSVEIAGPEYLGLGVMVSAEARAAGAAVDDAAEDFVGTRTSTSESSCFQTSRYRLRSTSVCSRACGAVQVHSFRTRSGAAIFGWSGPEF